MKDWYEERIEEPVRDIVKLLRDNGFNTECSCGHNMEVQCQYLIDGEFFELHKLIYNYLYEKGEKVDFEIDVRHVVTDGHSHSSFDVKLPSLRTSKEWLEEKRDRFIRMREYYDKRLIDVNKEIKKCKGKKKIKKLKNI